MTDKENEIIYVHNILGTNKLTAYENQILYFVQTFLSQL